MKKLENLDSKSDRNSDWLILTFIFIVGIIIGKIFNNYI